MLRTRKRMFFRAPRPNTRQPRQFRYAVKWFLPVVYLVLVLVVAAGVEWIDQHTEAPSLAGGSG